MKSLETVLRLSAFEGVRSYKIEPIQELVKLGKNIDKQYGGYTLLMAASTEGFLEAVNLLLQYGADPNISGTRGTTALMGSSYGCYDEISIALLDKGANVNAQDKSGMTALMMTAGVPASTGTMELLLAYKADINLRDVKGYSALDWMVEAQRPLHTLLLVNSRAELATSPEILCKPKKFAKYQHYIRIEAPLFTAAITGKKDYAADILNEIKDFDTRDDWEFTPLMYAAERGHLDITRVLLQHGANPNARLLPGGNTPFTLAVERSHAELAQLLLDYGAVVTMENPDGKTLLDSLPSKANEKLLRMIYAAAQTQNEHRILEGVKILLSEVVKTQIAQASRN